MKEFFQRFVATLTSEEKALLEALIREDRMNRFGTSGLDQHERDLCAVGRFSEALKSFRDRAQCSLIEAKREVDRWRDENGR